ncbi:MAG: RNA polymerase sigma factor [Bacteroidales bacterium]|nr:RNA polymerase sigma factor [Bacteroidales bacterium]
MSFDEVYRKYYKELRRFGHHLNITSEKAEDLIQETFLRYYLELEKDVVFKNTRAWLYKVLLNLFKTQFNAGKKEFEIREDLVVEKGRIYDPQDEYLNNEKQQVILKMLDRMAGKDREILLLYHNGFSYAEMAEILEINPNSVGQTLVRAIEKLKEILKLHYHEMFEQN